MENKKMTKRDYFNLIKSVMADNADVVAFCDREIELLNKKSSNSRDTKKQKENQALAEVVVTELAKIGKPVACAELINASDVLSEYTTQKLTPILKKLESEKRVVVTTEKKRNYYSVV